MRMVRLNTLLACALMGPMVWAQTAPVPAAAASAPAAPGIRMEVRTPLLEAQNLIQEKKLTEAKEKIKAANAVANRTPYESYIINRVALTVAINEDDAAGSAKLLEQILELSAKETWLKQDEILQLIHAVGIAHYRTKDYAGAAIWMERNLAAGGTEQSVKDVRIQSYLLGGNLQKGSDLINEAIAKDIEAKTAPPQAYLTMLVQARSGLKDTAGATRALELLVQHYPSKDHWRSLINRLWARADLASRLQLDVFRLAFYAGVLEEATDYTEYVDFAQKAGFSAEALRAYDQGATAGQMGAGAQAEAHKKLRAKLVTESEQDRKTMVADTAAALKKPDGLALFNIGLNMVGMQQFDKGLELMEKAITKGLAKRPEDARLRLAVAYAQAGQADKARQTLASVSGPEGLDDLVRYWGWAIRKP
jgi:tetratricopeptide (TPR) repeat protein